MTQKDRVDDNHDGKIHRPDKQQNVSEARIKMARRESI